ncbi:hypothetical protein PT065_07845 [Erysipelothrix rhusiopathiae]|nr:hypothetical protein [Erysipelothrix rhusiopathiae]MDE8314262.1 hypothetical protein [Erysipelothrix rhusiopathiae]
MSTDTKTEIKGKVIKILNEYRIAVNLGKYEVTEGDSLFIIDNSVEICDPETHEKLGVYTFKKEEIIVKETFSKYSICSPSRTKKVESSLISAMNPLMNASKTITVPFSVEENENENIYLKNKSIKIGDIVVAKI